ncbi:hypothetical protein QWA_11997 [Alcaligenes faecalis subsp. faecalis NCIB 8687]|nr:hypothetical protein QWA_11997 [Alcaligenes faecalis subsp. faecalis NCIB 8687]
MNGVQPGQVLAVSEPPHRHQQGGERRQLVGRRCDEEPGSGDGPGAPYSLPRLKTHHWMGPAVFPFTKAPGSMAPSSF